MKDVRQVYYIEQRVGQVWVEVPGAPMEASEIDQAVIDLCNANPFVAFRKVEAEILEPL
jgi:hypothetical protein